jgi:hypothetical protein
MNTGRPGVRRIEPLTRIDVELGPVRWCRQCAEWWPDDDVFWTVVPAGTVSVAAGRAYVRKLDIKRCRAHVEERIRVPWDVRRDAWRTPRAHHCRNGNCIVIVPEGREHCHGCDGRLAGPLMVDRLASLGSTHGERWAA